MPLPRFLRLAPDEQRRILDVAQQHFARAGRDGASIHAIIAEAGISKSSAYHYFDGKDDLFGAVVGGVLERLAEALGTWQPATTPEQFWTAFAEGTQRLSSHLAAHPQDRALLAAAAAGGDGGPLETWWEAALGDARDLALVTSPLDPALVAEASRAVVGAVDGWGLTRPEVPGETSASQLRALLEAVWAAGAAGHQDDGRPGPGPGATARPVAPH